MSGFKALEKLPKSIFTGGATDELTQTIASNISDVVKPINNYKRNLVEGLDELKIAIPSLKGMEGISDKTKSALATLDEKLNVSKVFDKIHGLSDDVKRSFLSATNFVNNFNPTTLFSIGKEIFSIRLSDLPLAEGLSNIMKVVQDNNFLKNITSKVKNSLVAIGLDISGSLGLSGVAKSLIETLTNAKDRVFAWGQAAYSFIGSDITTTVLALREGGLPGFVKLTSNPISHVLSRFNINPTKVQGLSNNRDLLMETLGLINSNWAYTTRPDGQKIWNLDNFRYAGRDALTVLESVPEYRSVASTAQLVNKQPTRDILSRSYPILEKQYELDKNRRYPTIAESVAISKV